MRLINVHTMILEEFLGDDVPSYFILSHTWGKEEVSHQDFVTSSDWTSSRGGYVKIQNLCNWVRQQNVRIGYVWVDTCCIDKKSSAELSEAINAMYRWYAMSKCCIVLLDDFRSDDSRSLADTFRRCRWFSRGWCLQELIAPPMCYFLDGDWKVIGLRSKMAQILSDVTGIQEEVLEGEPPQSYNVATRMSWAAMRQTTRPEDMAYCLLGLLQVNLPLLYGEGGERAFLRLQEEVVRSTPDWSIFTWLGKVPHNESALYDAASCNDRRFWRGLFASSPAEFHLGPLLGIPWHASTSVGEVAITSLGVKFSGVDLIGTSSHHNSDNSDVVLEMRLGTDDQNRPAGIYIYEAQPALFVRVYPWRHAQTRTAGRAVLPPYGSSGVPTYFYHDNMTFHMPRSAGDSRLQVPRLVNGDSFRWRSMIDYTLLGLRPAYGDSVRVCSTFECTMSDAFPAPLWARTRSMFFKPGPSLVACLSIRPTVTPSSVITLFLGVESKNRGWCYLTLDEEEAGVLRKFIKRHFEDWATCVGQLTLHNFFPYRIHRARIPGFGVIEAKCSYDRRVFLWSINLTLRRDLEEVSSTEPSLVDVMMNRAEGFVDVGDPNWNNKINYIAESNSPW